MGWVILMKKAILSLSLLHLILVFFVLPVSAHGGKTDGDGGHTDHDTGEYHYHHGYPAHDHYDMDGDGDLDCPYDFDDKTDHRSPSNKSDDESSQKFSKKYFSDDYVEGFQSGKEHGYDDGYEDGYDVGYADGCRDAEFAARDDLSEKLKENTRYTIVGTLAISIFVVLPIATIIWESLMAPTHKKTPKVSVEPPPAKHKSLHHDATGAVPVESSCISTVEYHDQAIYITFKTGGKYCYYNVPKSVYTGLLSSHSKGKYFHEHIDGKYPYAPIA